VSGGESVEVAEEGRETHVEDKRARGGGRGNGTVADETKMLWVWAAAS